MFHGRNFRLPYIRGFVVRVQLFIFCFYVIFDCAFSDGKKTCLFLLKNLIHHSLTTTLRRREHYE